MGMEKGPVVASRSDRKRTGRGPKKTEGGPVAASRQDGWSLRERTERGRMGTVFPDRLKVDSCGKSIEICL